MNTQPQLPSTVPSVALAAQPGQRQQREAAGDEFEAEQHDHHEADRKDQRADEGLAGLHRGADSQAGGEAEQCSGQCAAHQQIQSTHQHLGGAGLHHGGDDIDGLDAVHACSPGLAVWPGGEQPACQ